MEYKDITVKKINGLKEPFDYKKVRTALRGAFRESHTKYAHRIPDELCQDVLHRCEEQGKNNITVEWMHDYVEMWLMQHGYEKAAKAYIIHRENKSRIRQFVAGKKKYLALYAASGNTADATVDDNSNVGSKNVGVANNEIHKEDNIETNRVIIMDKIRELYPDFDAKQYIRDLHNHRIYKHDESSFSMPVPYCNASTMYPFLNNGIKGIGGLSAKPENLDSYCGMLINLIFAISAQFAGACAVPEALLYFDYFARKEWGNDYYNHPNSFYKIGYKMRKLLNASHYWTDNVEELRTHDFGSDDLNALRDELVYNSERPLTEEELRLWKEQSVKNPNFQLKLGDGTRTIGGQIHQHFQQIVYSINQPAAARGMQSAFVNFSYFDRPFFDGMFGDFRFPDFTAPLWDSLNWLQKDFMTWFNDERLRCILTFPVESFALVYKDGHFLDQENADFVADEYARGHSFFTYISDTVDSLSSCCRLKNKLQTKEFNFTNGNMGVQTGSKSVITCNLARITQDFFTDAMNAEMGVPLGEKGYEAFRMLRGEFMEYIKDILERVYIYHTAYNEVLWQEYNDGLLPVYRAGFIHLDKQYLTLGINGLNQAAEYLGIRCSDNDAYQDFCSTIFSTFKECNAAHKTKFNGHQLTFNTEMVPAESLAVKNYNWDKSDGYWVPEDTNLYASYVFKPNDADVSVLEKIRLHGSRFIGDYLDGGTAAHINLSEHLSSTQYRHLLKYAADNGCQYFTFNIPNSECQDCGFITKHNIDKCPRCGSEHVAHYDRVIGYLTRIDNWSEGRRIEQKTRVYETVNE